ncbi:MAG: helix-turn-helix transcriptional regulator [Bacilli bacterium]|nr:helix-turn-helix transcriptional regulator [Bacilli bacterium]
MNLSENIKKIRKENNLSQEQLAEKLGVSRQSVSKWESGQAYPEMDKVIQICDLFNLNMDELMKSDLTDVRESKQSKANINKYVDDFFSFITKTIDMFSALKFKAKIKCLFEQAIIAIGLFLLFFFLGAFFSEIFRKLFGFITENAYWVLLNIFEAIYLVISIILFLAIFLHIFKIRYLDYFVIVKEEKDLPLEVVTSYNEEVQVKEDKKIELSKKQEKVVIRDPNHSGYRFLSGLLKCALWGIKLIALGLGVFGIISLIVLAFAIVIPFLYLDAKLLFGGSIICIFSAIIINLVILNIIFNFIISKKCKKNFLAILFICAVVLLGVGGGIVGIGLTNIKYIPNLSENEKITTTIEIDMNDELVLDLEYYKNDVEYIISNNKNIIVEVLHSKYLEVDTHSYNSSYIYLTAYPSEYKIFDMINAYIKDLNKYEVRDREVLVTKIYTSRENIEKLQSNLDARNNENYLHEQEVNTIRNYYEKIINDYQRQIDDLNSQLIEQNENC